MAKRKQFSFELSEKTAAEIKYIKANLPADKAIVAEICTKAIAATAKKAGMA